MTWVRGLRETLLWCFWGAVVCWVYMATPEAHRWETTRSVVAALPGTYNPMCATAALRFSSPEVQKSQAMQNMTLAELCWETPPLCGIAKVAEFVPRSAHAALVALSELTAPVFMQCVLILFAVCICVPITALFQLVVWCLIVCGWVCTIPAVVAVDVLFMCWHTPAVAVASMLV